MKNDKNAICFIHDGMLFPKRRAAAQASPENHEGHGPYLCLECAEALQTNLPLRWIVR